MFLCSRRSTDPVLRVGAVEHGERSLLSLLLAGLLSAVQATSHLPADYVDVGPPPEDPIGATKRLLAGSLRDPDSAQYRFIGLHPAKCRAGWAQGDNGWQGWAATIEVNGKNAFGGYTGFQTRTVLFVGQDAWRVLDGPNFAEFGPSKGLLGLAGGAGVCRYLDQ